MAARPRSLDKQRARSAEDKAVRRQQLLAAAARLLSSHAYEQLSLAAVAREAGLSKASAYTYFETREALFLALLVERLEAWRDVFLARLPARRRSPRGIARILAESLADDPLLRDLLARLHSVLEVNVSDAEIVAFKQFLAVQLATCATRVYKACPELRPGQAEHLFMLAHSLTIGLGMACTPVPNVSRALAAMPELENAFELDFTTELENTLELILRGWLADNAARREKGQPITKDLCGTPH